jgi:hypothetical protein
MLASGLKQMHGALDPQVLQVVERRFAQHALRPARQRALGHFRQRVGDVKGVEHRGQAGVENAVEGKDVDAHGNYGIKIGKFANLAKAAAGLYYTAPY